MAGSCYTCIKYLMFAFNFLFWLLGCAILGVGIWIRVDQDVAQYVNQSAQVNLLYTFAYILITIGIVIMIIGFLGCCGAIRESQCMLGTFFVCLFVIFAILLGVGIWAVVAKEDLKGVTGNMLQEAVDNYDEPNSKSFLDTVQIKLQCCGATKGADDFKITAKIPESCKLPNYIKPCNEKFFNFIADHLIIVAGVFIGIAVVLILGMIFAMVLCCAIRDTTV
ncbi:CD9 antigen-like [Gigantopelta aegis]|uniref:CD9 antigen-like n=1 Tax=Gigantopelta aegis TaxID=1735272 RepID=UPI001B88E16A|nr:CD9 antigen-like [Gigantopelta aegis]